MGLQIARALHGDSIIVADISEEKRDAAVKLGAKEVYDEVSQGKFTDISPELLNAAEDMHYSRYFDEAGDLDISKDPYLEAQFKEVTLTTELKGFSKRLEEAFQHTPWAKPFFCLLGLVLMG